MWIQVFRLDLFGVSTMLVVSVAVYKELVLPQLENCPFLTEEVDDYGTSCRDLLDRLLEKQQRHQSSNQEVNNSSHCIINQQCFSTWRSLYVFIFYLTFVK